MKFPTRVYFRILFAALGAAVFEILADFVDCLIVGRILGETAVAGFELLMPVIEITLAVSLLVAGGTVVVHSRSMGGFDRRRADEAFSTGIMLAVLLGLLGAVLLGVGLEAYFGFFPADAKTLGFARDYGYAYVPVVAALPLMSVLMAAVLEDGDSRVFTVSTVCGLVVRITASWVLVRRIGISGCAWGAFLSILISCGILCIHFFRKACSLALRPSFSLSSARRILVANPSGPLTEFAHVAILLFANWFVIRAFGSRVLPVVALIFLLDSMTYVFTGFANAAQPIVGIYHSERNYRALRSFVRMVLSVATGAGFCASVCLAIWPQVPIALLGFKDPSLVLLARHALRITSISVAFAAVHFFLESYYAFIGELALSTFFTVLCYPLMSIACVFIGGTLFGLEGVWVAFALAVPLAFAVFFVFVALWRRHVSLPFLLPDDRNAKLWTWNVCVAPESSCAVARRVGRILRERGVGTNLENVVSVAVEEILETIRGRNGTRTVHAEITLDLNDGIELFERDDGEVFDVTDVDRRLDSLRDYFLTALLAGAGQRNNQTAIGFNRNHLRF